MAGPAALKRVVTSISADARFEGLPAEVQFVWYRFQTLSFLQAEPGRVLTIGPFVEYFARRLGVDPAPLAQDLEMLSDCGFLELDEDGRGASLPGIVWRGDEASLREGSAAGQGPRPAGAPRQRSEAQIAASRRNGQKSSGRPRKVDPRQGYFMHAVPSGGVQSPGTIQTDPEKNPSETRERNPSAPLSGISQVSPGFSQEGRGGGENQGFEVNSPPPPSLSTPGANPSETQGPGTKTPAQVPAENPGQGEESLARELAGFVHDELRLDHLPLAQVRRWLGAKVAADVIRQAATRTKASLKPGERVHSANIMDGRIEAILREAAPKHPEVPKPLDPDEEEYQAELAAWKKRAEAYPETKVLPGPRPTRKPRAA